MNAKQFLRSSRLIGVLVILLGLVILIAQPTNAQGSVSIEIDPTPKTVAVNDVFDVTVQVVAGAQQVDAAEIHLAFDPALLQVQSLVAGADLQATLIPPTYDNGLGTIAYAVGTFSAYPSGTFIFIGV